MARSIYDQHEASFRDVSAFTVSDNGRLCATIALKFPRDGAGRLLAYVHWHGIPMARGFAGGYGYDKRSAAIADAARKMPADLPPGFDIYNAAYAYRAFRAAIARDDGMEWDGRLRDAGFAVWRAV